MSFIPDARVGINVHAKPSRGSICAAVLLLASALLMVSPLAHAGELDKVVAFDIAPTTLDKALLEFGAEERLQIMFAWNSLTVSLPTRELKGSYTGKQALAKILQGTRLAYIERDHTLEILPQTSADSRSSAGDRKSLHARSGGDPEAPNNPGSKNLDPPATFRYSRSDQPAQGLGEVVVTAQKYRQPAFDVPISLDVVTAQELQRLNITSLNDLQYDVPGMYVQGGNVSHYIVLRGVSNLAGNGSLVGEYIDDADMSSEGYVGQAGYGAGNIELYDLDRVEVLKGPQGTLYGDGALGGVIRYITNKPNLQTDELGADVSALFTQDGAPSQYTEMMLNSPLIAGTLGLRVAGEFQHNGGWVDEPIENIKAINSNNTTDVRIEALWQPTTGVKALATQVIHREAYGIGAGEDSQGNITPVLGATSVPNGEQSFSLSNLTLTADFSRAQLLSSTTYLSHTETDYNQSYVLSADEVELLHALPIENEALSEELRLHSTRQGPWQWLIGGLFKHELDHGDVGALAYFGPPTDTVSTVEHEYITDEPQQSNSDAAYADTSFKLLEDLTIGAGVRYFQDRFRTTNDGVFVDNNLVAPYSFAQENFASTDPRLYVLYRQSGHVNLYASAAKGFRSGEPDLGLFRGYSPESLWSYDLGTKMQFLRGRLLSDADVFYENYSNYVGEGLISVSGLPTFGTFNIGAAKIKGLDADVTWILRDGWRFSAKGELVDSKFVSVTAASTGYFLGERLPFVPPYTLTGSVERAFRVADKPAFVLVSYSQAGRVDSDTSPNAQSDVIRLLSVRTGVRVTSSLQVAIFAQNLLNDRGFTEPNEERAGYRPRPRTFGIDFSASM